VSVATSIDQLCINTIRGLSMDAVQAANSGHPGMPMGAAPMAHALWTRHLRHNPKDPKWFNRDRFILSAGHGSMLLYSLLHLTGYDLPLAEIKNFRQWGSMTPGHPENILTPGVEMATGPLGQGFATGVGMAIAERHLAAAFNRGSHRVVDHFTYAICSDGDLMEGVANEAASLAGHLGLGKLIYLYDANRITIDGPLDLSFSENVDVKFRAFGWQVIKLEDGMDVDAVDEAIKQAKANQDQPSLIICPTVIGYGSPNKADSSKAHGSPLGPEEVDLAKDELGIPKEPKFHIPEEALQEYRKAVEQGAKWQEEWQEAMRAYEAEHAEEAATLRKAISGEWGREWLGDLPSFDEKLATRAASGKVINAVAPHIPTLIGGSGDLAESNNTEIKGSKLFHEDLAGRNIAFGVREHAMMAAVNGITLHGGCRGYGATFLIFSDYCKASIRLAALMECPSIFIFTHDSIGLGEDGPTHQPIEHLAGLRAIPNLNLMRPADGNETAACWKIALQSRDTPCAFALTRQGLPAVTPADVDNHPAEKGAYVLAEASGDPACILVATGSEVQVALAAREVLEGEGVSTRVVSMPSWLLFSEQKDEYRAQVLPPNVPTVSVEAASTFGWGEWAQVHVGLDRFGASAPGDVNMREFGFTPEDVAEAARQAVKIG
jgi:transketolase